MNSYLNKFKMKDKIAFVVGGLGLIGSEITKALCCAGAKTIVLDVDQNKGNELIKEILKAGYDAEFVYFDISDLDNISFSSNFSKLINYYKKINVYINCSYPRTDDWAQNTFKDIALESYRRNVDIHLNSYVWLSRQVANIMVDQKNGGSIINLGSTYGVVGQDLTVYEGTSMSDNMTYAVIKGGIANLTRLMASYYGKYNIRINTLCPGGIFDGQNQEFVKSYSKKVPLKRMGEPEEIASTALFLASDAASYITGATIMVDGGWTAI